MSPEVTSAQRPDVRHVVAAPPPRARRPVPPSGATRRRGTRPAPPDILAAVHKSLKPDGRLVLVEFREEDENVPILPLHKMSQPQVVKELEANGFKLVGQFDRLPWQHVLYFSREDSPLPKVALRLWRP